MKLYKGFLNKCFAPGTKYGEMNVLLKNTAGSHVGLAHGTSMRN